MHDGENMLSSFMSAKVIHKYYVTVSKSFSGKISLFTLLNKICWLFHNVDMERKWIYGLAA